MSLTPKGAYDLSGWEQITCYQADLVRRGSAELSLASSYTDVDKPDVFTEWWWTGPTVRHELPVLREYRDERGCRHYLAVDLTAADGEIDLTQSRRRQTHE